MKGKSRIVIELKELLESQLKNSGSITTIRKVYIEEKIQILDDILKLNLN